MKALKVLGKCDLCKNSFVTEDYLKIHITAFHERIYKAFKCDFCQKNFTQKPSLKQHIETVHEGI